MAKLMEEERLLEQQHFEAEQNKLHSHPMPTPPKPSNGNKDNDKSPGGHDKKFQRWPSLEKIKQLRDGMGVIHEVTSGQETDINTSAAGTLIFEEAGRSSSTPEHAKPLLVTTESETDHKLHWTQRNIRPFGEAGDESPIISVPEQSAAPAPEGQKVTGDQTTEAREPAKTAEARDSAKERSPGTKKKLKYRRKSTTKKSSAEGHDLLRVFQTGYSKLSEDSSSDDDKLPLSPVHRAIAERHLAQIPSPHLLQAGTDEVKSKLASLEERLANLEQSSQRSLSNIESLLQSVVIHQREPPQIPPPAASPPEVPLSVNTLTSQQNNYGISNWVHQHPRAEIPPSQYPPLSVTLTQRPSSAGYPVRTDLPPTHPPTRAFQSFDDLV